ncbi:MAG: stage III sporulation protein AE [Firmicutes bacterium]|nr:stage III sporulation protein AE [Bacillota bacterium]
MATGALVRAVMVAVAGVVICAAVPMQVAAATSALPSTTMSQQPARPSVAGTPLVQAERESRQLGGNAIQSGWNDLAQQYEGFVPVDDNWVQAFLPGGDVHARSFAQGLLRFLLTSLWSNARLLGAIFVLVVLVAILESVQAAFASEFVGKVAFLAVNLALIALAAASFRSAASYAGGAIDQMNAVMYGSLPVVLALIAASGGISSAAVFHPLIVFAVDSVGLAVKTLILPLIFLSAALYIVSSLTDRYQVTELAKLLQTITVTALGGMLTVFLGVMTVEGSLSAVADGVTMRSAKFVTGNLIPIVGKALSDATEMVAGASLLLKNATGIAGAVLLLAICAFPAIKILALALAYSGSAALLQPLGDTPAIAAVAAVGRSLVLVFAALAAVGLMFFFSLVIAISATNMTAFVR